jgi:hypothetical protein
VIVPAGVLVPAPVCERYGPLLDLLVRSRARLDGVPVAAELDGVLRELVTAGLAHRASVGGSVPDRPAETASESSVMTADEVAGRLGVTPHRVRQLARAGRLGRRDGGRWVIDADEVEEMCA